MYFQLPILFPFVGMLLSLLLYLISYAPSVDVWSVLLAGGFISGLFGEVGLILMAGNSYVTDVTGLYSSPHSVSSQFNIITLKTSKAIHLSSYL